MQKQLDGFFLHLAFSIDNVLLTDSVELNAKSVLSKTAIEIDTKGDLRLILVE